MTLWGGRFDSSMSEPLWALSESYPFDRALYAHDLRGSRAHVRGLRAAGLLSEEETEVLVATLDRIEAEFATGAFTRAEGDEDVHTAIERRATELAGPVGAKLHTARSRNDQVATALRLYTRDALSEIAALALELTRSLVELAERYPGAYLPGYTHLQRAQPVPLAHHLYAHAWALLRDVDRLADARERMDVSPLGAGALAGTSLPVDPAVAAALLGFSRAFENSMDAVSDRDFVAEALFDVALLGVHLSRMGEELVLWTSTEFGFATLGDDFTTGSSMLPHKKNSDVAELARAKAGRFIGNLTAVLVVLKGLPLTYNRDLQEDKEPLFDSVNQVRLVLTALSGACRAVTFDEQRARAAADDHFLVAMDLAEELVRRGVPFREAHERVGRAVGDAVRRGVDFAEVVRESDDLSSWADHFEPGYGVAHRRSPGGAGAEPVLAQRERLQRAIADAGRRLG
jgi:argininosuccinate lyase